MVTKLLPAEATHNTLDFSWKTASAYYFRECFYSKNWTILLPDAPMLEIEVLGDRNNFIDLQKVLPEKKTKSAGTMTAI